MFPPDTPLTGTSLPDIRPGLPGARSHEFVELLARYECPGLTARRRRREELSGASHDPIVWRAARGANVLDADGNVYVDLTAGFGAALVGHSHPHVIDAIRTQSERMIHALGDVYPSDVKVALEARLASLCPWPARVILGLSGADAVEAAVKTACLATGRPGVVAFTGGYHGLSYGTVALCGYKADFRAPFVEQLNARVMFAPFPCVTTPDPSEAERSLDATFRALDSHLATGTVGAVIVEPILGRGGVETPASGFLAELIERAHRAGAVVIADEIYTGLGRTGRVFRSVRDEHIPDVLCVGKALGGGMPVSACLIREDIAAAWGSSTGEAIHTSTFLGNPLGCAAALASLDVLLDPETALAIRTRAERFEESLNEALRDHRLGVPRRTFARLLIGLALEGGAPRTLAVMRALLERGFIVLPGGVRGDVLTLTPPCTITDAQIDAFAEALGDVLRAFPVS